MAKQAELLETPTATVGTGRQALQPVEPEFVGMFERLARDTNVPVEKLEKLIALQERILASNARAEYYAAFAAMQGELPVISERGEIIVNGQVRSKYAKNEDIQQAIRPILQKHGFALSFRNEFKDSSLKIIGILSHRSGHAEQDEFVAKADTSGSKNDIQALGSTRSYGQRYTTIALLNIATSGEDDDGQQAERKEIEAPPGFAEWWDGLAPLADRGTLLLGEGWNRGKTEWRNHVLKTNKAAWEGLKRKAAAVK